MNRSSSIPMLLAALSISALALATGVSGHPAAPMAAPGQVVSLALVAQLGGASRAVVAQGARAVAGVGAAVVVLDAPAGAEPAVVGRVDLPGVVAGLVAGPRYAYVAAGYAGLQVVDLLDPRAPRLVGSLVDPDGAEAWDVFLDGGRVYVAERMDVLDRIRAIDVSDPARPRALGSYSPPASGIVDADVLDGVAYLVDGDVLTLVGFADPAAPRELGTHDTPGEAGGVSAATGRALVLDTDVDDVTGEYVDWVRVVDVADPSAPAALGAYQSPGIVRDLSATGDRVYLLEAEAVRIVDVANPARPVGRGVLALPGGPLSVGLDGPRLVTGLATGGLAFVDATDPGATVVTAAWVVPGAPHDVALADGHVTQLEKDLASGVRLVGVADPARPVTEGYVGTPGEARRIAARSGHAFVADGWAGLRVVSLADPALPQLVGAYSLAQEANGLALAGNRVYLAAGQDGLVILDVVDPARPRVVGAYDGPGDAWGVAVAGDRAFVAELDMIRVVDVSDPRVPRPLGAIAIEAYEGNLAWADDRLYVPTADGLVVVDAANPAAMRELGRVALAGGANDVALDGGLAWVTSPGGVHGVDLAGLVEVATYFTPAYAEGVAVDDGLVYVAAYDAGLYVLAAAGAGTPPAPTATATVPATAATATRPAGGTPTSTTGAPTGTPTGLRPTATADPERRTAYLPALFRNR